MKRAFDVAVAAVLMILLTPLLLMIALLVYAALGRPVIFRQQRPGKDGNPFWILKFRTMKDQYDESGRMLDDSLRLTRFGRWLRATSLDELPELINVLKGDMSLVGPRPLLMEYLPLYSDEQRRRHHVRPGITGWAQVNGRNAISWEEKLSLDVWYVEHRSFWLDMRILWLTALKVFRAEGVTQVGHATTEKFKGRNA